MYPGLAVARAFGDFVAKTVTPTALDPLKSNRKSQFHESTGELESEVNSHYLSRSQWLQLPNTTARRGI